MKTVDNIYKYLNKAFDILNCFCILGNALAGFTPFFIGLVFYFTGLWKKGKKTKA